MPIELSQLGLPVAAALRGLPEDSELEQSAIRGLPEALAAKARTLGYVQVSGSRTLATTDAECAIDMEDAGAILTIPDQSAVEMPDGFRALVRWRAGGQLAAPGVASLDGAPGNTVVVPAPVASEVKAVWLYRVAADQWWAIPTSGDADISALYTAVAANTAAIAGKAAADHQHTMADITDLSADILDFMAADDAAAARAALELQRKLSSVAISTEAVTVDATHADKVIDATHAAPTVTFALQSTASYPAQMTGAIFFPNGGYVAVAAGGSINGAVDPAPVAIAPYGLVGYWRRGDDDFVVGYPGSGDGGGGGATAISEIIGLPEALAAKYSDPGVVATALEGRSAAAKLATLDAHCEALKAAPGLLQVNAAGTQINTVQPVVPPSVTYANLMAGAYTGLVVRPAVLVEPYEFKTVVGAGGAQTIDPAVIGGPNILITTANATELVTIAAKPETFLFIFFENSGGGARDVSLVSSGAADLLTIEYAEGVDPTLNLGSTAGDLIGFHLTRVKPNFALITGVVRK